jgi:hypothetical protein
MQTALIRSLDRLVVSPWLRILALTILLRFAGMLAAHGIT